MGKYVWGSMYGQILTVYPSVQARKPKVKLIIKRMMATGLAIICSLVYLVFTFEMFHSSTIHYVHHEMLEDGPYLSLFD